MSLAGFKKQINKANQYMSEKIGGAKGTELDEEFNEMERKVDVMGKLVDELMARTHELLQPNPASRAKLSAVNSISKFRGQAKNALYPQPEGQLGECMIRYGNELGDESEFGKALMETGESYREMADVKYSLEDNVKQNFIEPLLHLQTKDLKEVNYLRKKLSGRRLDYDCKKRKKDKAGAHVPELELHEAQEKFVESKDLAETAMYNLLENDVEQISQLSAFLDAEYEYHRQTADILQTMSELMRQRLDEVATKPRREHVPQRIASFSRYDRAPSPMHDGNDYNLVDSTGYSLSPAQPAFGSVTSSKEDLSKGSKPCCEALYDFDPENEGELGFAEGDIINLISRIDENWYEGSVNGQTGFFPVNYVKVIVDVQ